MMGRIVKILLLSSLVSLGALGFIKLDVFKHKVKGEMTEMNTVNKDIRKATFAGGCFWCVEADFRKVPGVLDVVSGYAGGTEHNPTYEEVSSGRTGHVEAIQVSYDAERVNYEQLLDVFWRSIDPTDPGGQFADRGPQYRTAIFYHDDQQRRLAEQSKTALERSGRFDKPIATEIRNFVSFYNAEEYHQEYSEKQPLRYKIYRQGSGRDRFIEQTWKDMPHEATGVRKLKVYDKPDDETLRKKLAPMQYDVTQNEATEPPFMNEYWANEREGLYVDVVTGEPLFSSLDKFQSNCGWPSFSKPLEPDNIIEKEDTELLMKRTEVRSRHADSHLGHVFDDGPAPTGLRYCINSAAVRFIPKEDLEKEGYGEYLHLFATEKKGK